MNRRSHASVVDHDRVGGEDSEQWQIATLGRYIKVKHGYAFEGNQITSEETPNILVTPGNFYLGGGFKATKFKYFSGYYPSAYKLSGGDIVVTMTDLSKDGDTLGYGARIPSTLGKSYLHNQRIGLVEFLNGEVDENFLYWVLRTREYQGFVLGAATGTSVRHTSPTTIQQYEFSLPSSRKEQAAIAALLDRIDDKIDLLKRQNKTLESMAEALFRHWFVEEAQDDWKKGVLGDIAANVRCSIKASDISPEAKYVGLEHIDRRSVALNKHGYGENVGSNKSIFVVNDILFGKLRPYFHKVCFAPFSGVCSTDILVVAPKRQEYFAFCLFAFFQDDVVEYVNLGSGGTRMPRTDWSTLKDYPIVIPDLNFLERFNAVVVPALERITCNLGQIRTLERLRDTLLPKLMSGEVRVRIESSAG